MVAFDLLGVGFANGMRSRGEMPLIDSSPIRVAVLQAKGLAQLLQLDEDSIRATPEGIRQHHPTQMVDGMPQPTLVGVALHDTPHFIHLRGFDAPHVDRDRLWTTAFHDAGVDPGKTRRFSLILEARYWPRHAGRGQYRGSHSH